MEIAPYSLRAFEADLLLPLALRWYPCQWQHIGEIKESERTGEVRHTLSAHSKEVTSVALALR